MPEQDAGVSRTAPDGPQDPVIADATGGEPPKCAGDAPEDGPAAAETEVNPDGSASATDR